MRYLIKIHFFFFLIWFSGCINPSEKICLREIRFEIPYTLSPAIDTFSIGDTIWIEGILPNMLEDLNSKEMINITDFNFKTRIGIYSFTTSEFNLADFSFEYINTKGAFEHHTTGTILVTKLIYEKEENQKAFKVGMIPIAPGGFYISFYNLTEDLFNVSLINSNCQQSLELNYKMNDGQNNFHFIENEPINISKEGFDKDGSYAFWVVE